MSVIVFACYSAACRPPTSGGTGGSKSSGGGGGGSKSSSGGGSGSSGGSSGGGAIKPLKLEKTGLTAWTAGDYSVTKKEGAGYAIHMPGSNRTTHAKTVAEAGKKINAHNKKRGEGAVTDQKSAEAKRYKSDQINPPAKFTKTPGKTPFQDKWSTPGGHYEIERTHKGYQVSVNTNRPIGTRTTWDTAIGRSDAKTLKAAQAQAMAHFKKYGAEMNDWNKTATDKGFHKPAPMRAKDTIWYKNQKKRRKKKTTS